MDKGKHNVLSLFSSAGIAEFGFNGTPFNVVLSSELLPIRAQTHNFWHNKTQMINGDITKSEVKKEIIEKSKKLKVDFIFATPPCQGVSLIGKNKSNIQMLKDERNFLIFHAMEIFDKVNPNFILIENVPRFLNIKYHINKKPQGIVEILRDKYGEKYNIESDIYDAEFYGVPQHRERAIIRMWKKDLGLTWDEPVKDKKIITVKDAIGSLPSLEQGQSSNIKNHYARNHVKRHVDVMKHTATGHSALENKKFYPINPKTGKKVKGYAATYKRISWDKPAPTITMRNDCISSQSNVHPGRLLKDGTYSDARVLTPRELFVLMSMDPDLDIPGFLSDIQLRQIVGEAVPPKLINKILRGIK